MKVGLNKNNFLDGIALDNDLIRNLKSNKLLLSKEIANKADENIEDKINVENVSMYRQLSTIFYLPSVNKITSDNIQRCFATVAKTPNFLELDFNHVNEILSSSKINISSELQVFNAADNWLSCKISERKKFAKELFLKIRFPLLPDHVLKKLFQKRLGLRSSPSSSFHKNEDCLVLINKVLQNKEEYYRGSSSKYYTNRYCSSKMFNILFCGGIDKITAEFNKNVYQSKNLQNFNTFAKMTEKKIWDVVCLKGELYVFHYRLKKNRDEVHSFEKYSFVSKTWETLTNWYENFTAYCVCSFVDSIFVIGGFGGVLDDDDINGRLLDYSNSCIEYNVHDKKWKENSRMNEKRTNAAAAVFEGRVVVSGGINSNGHLNTVEVFDHVAGTWSKIPNMIHTRFHHKMIPVGNKLFVVGGKTNVCEVYDTFCKKFAALKLRPEHLNFNFYCLEAVSIGRKIMVFNNNSPQVAAYDVDEEKWSEESCEVTKNLKDYYCVKVPRI